MGNNSSTVNHDKNKRYSSVQYLDRGENRKQSNAQHKHREKQNKKVDNTSKPLNQKQQKIIHKNDIKKLESDESGKKKKSLGSISAASSRAQSTVSSSFSSNYESLNYFSSGENNAAANTDASSTNESSKYDLKQVQKNLDEILNFDKINSENSTTSANTSAHSTQTENHANIGELFDCEIDEFHLSQMLGLLRQGGVLIKRSKSYAVPENKVLPKQFQAGKLKQTNLLRTEGMKKTWRKNNANANKRHSFLIPNDFDTNFDTMNHNLKPSLVKNLLNRSTSVLNSKEMSTSGDSDYSSDHQNNHIMDSSNLNYLKIDHETKKFRQKNSHSVANLTMNHEWDKLSDINSLKTNRKSVERASAFDLNVGSEKNEQTKERKSSSSSDYLFKSRTTNEKQNNIKLADFEAKSDEKKPTKSKSPSNFFQKIRFSISSANKNSNNVNNKNERDTQIMSRFPIDSKIYRHYIGDDNGLGKNQHKDKMKSCFNLNEPIQQESEQKSLSTIESSLSSRSSYCNSSKLNCAQKKTASALYNSLKDYNSDDSESNNKKKDEYYYYSTKEENDTENECPASSKIEQVILSKLSQSSSRLSTGSGSTASSALSSLKSRNANSNTKKSYVSSINVSINSHSDSKSNSFNNHIKKDVNKIVNLDDFSNISIDVDKSLTSYDTSFDLKSNKSLSDSSSLSEIIENNRKYLNAVREKTSQYKNASYSTENKSAKTPANEAFPKTKTELKLAKNDSAFKLFEAQLDPTTDTFSKRIADLTNRSPALLRASSYLVQSNTNSKNSNQRSSFVETADQINSNKFKFVPNKRLPRIDRTPSPNENISIVPPKKPERFKFDDEYENMDDFEQIAKKSESMSTNNYNGHKRRSIQEIFPQIRAQKSAVHSQEDELSNPSLQNLNNFDREIKRNFRANFKSFLLD